MINKENVILIPGAIRDVRSYESYDGLDIWMNDNADLPANATCFVGHSLGVNYILNLKTENKHKFIFINPLVKKRGPLNLFGRWIKFLIFEGIRREKIIPLRHWLHMIKRIIALLKIDVLKEMQKIPKENLVVIKGKRDSFFCDDVDVAIMRQNNFRVIEVEAGHDWNKNEKGVDDIIEKLIQELTQTNQSYKPD